LSKQKAKLEQYHVEKTKTMIQEEKAIEQKAKKEKVKQEKRRGYLDQVKSQLEQKRELEQEVMRDLK